MVFNICYRSSSEIMLYKIMWRTCIQANIAPYSNIYIHLSPFFFLLSSTPIPSCDRLRKFLKHPLLTMLDPWNLFQIKPSVHTYFWKEKREGLIQFNSTCHIPHCLFIHKTIPIHLLKHSQTTSASFFLSGPRNNHTLFKVSRVPRIDSLLFL